MIKHGSIGVFKWVFFTIFKHGNIGGYFNWVPLLNNSGKTLTVGIGLAGLNCNFFLKIFVFNSSISSFYNKNWVIRLEVSFHKDHPMATTETVDFKRGR